MTLIDRSSLTKLFCQCFFVPATAESQTIAAFGEENLRVMVQNDELLGALALIPMAQWYGGQRVSCTGIGSVAIAPHQRGQGWASQLLQQSLQELQEQGTALSILYPATPSLYRKWGYERAGTWLHWQLTLQDLPRQTPALEIHPLPLGAKSLQPLYDRWAAQHNGLLDRHPGLWQLLLQSAPYAYCLGSVTDPQGYILYAQERDESGNRILLKDWVTLTPAATQASLDFFAQQQAQGDVVRGHGPIVDPRLLEQSVTIQQQRSWMLRIIHVKNALEQRGYPLHCELELHLAIEDPLFPNNNDRFCLQVSQGRGQVLRGGQGHLSVPIASLAPLFSGFLSPKQLQDHGYIEGDSHSLAIAHTLFYGSAPWLADFF
ncbi:MAG: GNAT family N-acetyltransferase [Prochlorotrichaceae cyanobacterium]